ncbi:uncharacterized protein N0V89_006031 [Didymosphaeria variabile]|uniref:Uncharacterized protein n=1 Tax=Didymosphaeria variabile TaxID=1932322 RepID=A0A9W8XLU3_9PLEO|nr:uncharacterized protein N0V89_006031 [Didymosphaeria variabile]KAJ4354297.1 hypothetical protein N0V89_006031 [Didymosphaeria variabile]
MSSFSKTGCNDHTYANGYNLSAKKVKSGLPADHRTEFERQQEANIIAERVREAEDAAEAIRAAQEQAAKKNKGQKGEKDTRKEKGKRRGNQH